MKHICLLFMFIFSPQVLSGELPYKKETVSAYLQSSSNVYLVKKIGGFISFSEYNNYLKEYAGQSYDEKKMFKVWKEIFQSKNELFLVLKTFKGSKFIGEVLESQYLESPSTSLLNSEYIIFFEESGENYYSYNMCDIFSFDRIPKDASKDFNKLIAFLGTSTLTPCLYEASFD